MTGSQLEKSKIQFIEKVTEFGDKFGNRYDLAEVHIPEQTEDEKAFAVYVDREGCIDSDARLATILLDNVHDGEAQLKLSLELYPESPWARDPNYFGYALEIMMEEAGIETVEIDANEAKDLLQLDSIYNIPPEKNFLERGGFIAVKGTEQGANVFVLNHELPASSSVHHGELSAAA